MLLRLSAPLLTLTLSSVLGVEEGSCSKDGGKPDCGAKKENKFKYYSATWSYEVHIHLTYQEDCAGDGGLGLCGAPRDRDHPGQHRLECGQPGQVRRHA